MSYWVAGAIVVTGYLQADAAGDAADAAQQGTNEVVNEQRRQYDLTREDFAPYREAGVNALGQLEGQIGQFDQNLPQYTSRGDFNFDLESDPGYIFARDEAIKATNREQAGIGGFNSGNRLAAIGDRVTGLASTYANDAFNRQIGTSRENYGRNLTDFGIATSQNQDLYGRNQDYLNRLASISGLGQTSTAQLGQFGANAANQISNAYGNNIGYQTNAINDQNQAYQDSIRNLTSLYTGGGSF